MKKTCLLVLMMLISMASVSLADTVDQPSSSRGIANSIPHVPNPAVDRDILCTGQVVSNNPKNCAKTAYTFSVNTSLPNSATICTALFSATAASAVNSSLYAAPHVDLMVTYNAEAAHPQCMPSQSGDGYFAIQGKLLWVQMSGNQMNAHEELAEFHLDTMRITAPISASDM